MSVRGGEGRRGEGRATYISPVSLCTPLQQNITLRLAVVGHTLSWEEVGYGCRTGVVSYMGSWEGWSQQCTCALCILKDSNFNQRWRVYQGLSVSHTQKCSFLQVKASPTLKTPMKKDIPVVEK